MDVLLGEDESQPKNRIVLICKQCRLVNGQAPPGIKQVEDIGRWRCSGCGMMNGEESEAKKIVNALQAKEKAEQKSESRPSKESALLPQVDGPSDETGSGAHNEDRDSDITQYSEDEGQERDETGRAEAKEKPIQEPEAPQRRSGRLKESK